MIRRTAIAGATLAAALLGGGCADLQNSITPPEWFTAKMAEVEGKGYPELSAVPTKQGSTVDQKQWDDAAASLEAKSAEVDQRLAEVDQIVAAELANEGGGSTDDAGIRASAAQLRAKSEKGSAP